MEIKEIIGIDVSKRTFDICIHSKEVHSVFENNKEGFKSFKKWLRKSIGKDLTKVRIVIEHTGLYSYQLEEYMHKENLSYSKVSGLAIKRSLGLLRGKTDKIDAKRIAEYGDEKKKKLKATPQQEHAVLRLKNLISLRDKFVRDKAGYLARLKEQQACLDLPARDMLVVAQERIIKAMEIEVDKLDDEINKLVRKDEAMSKNYDLITSIKGVGPVLATYTIAYTNNFKQFTNGRKFACFVGVAPFPYESGTSVKGKTKVSPLANKKIKSILYMCASSAIQYNPEMKAYYERRLQNGKTQMSTLNVIRNKIILRIFAVVRNQRPYSMEIPTLKI